MRTATRLRERGRRAPDTVESHSRHTGNGVGYTGTPSTPETMAADASLNFEVATIKPSNPSTPGQSILVGRGGGNLFTTTNTTLQDLIIFSYGLHVQQIEGGASWLTGDKFDISAKRKRREYRMQRS
jgi:hypothetical protein